jgi:hypothetical protein
MKEQRRIGAILSADEITAWDLMSASGPGCVKTLDAVVGMQQWNQRHRLNKHFLRARRTA